MSRARSIVPLLALLGLAGWAVACGDGTTEPSPPPPPPDPPRATTVTVTPATDTLAAFGDTVRLAAEVRDQNGRPMAGAPVAWSSGNAAVATVDASGLVTAAGNGSGTITATAGSASGSATVTVAQAVSAVAVSPAADTLVAFGDTVRLAAEASDTNGHAVLDAEFAWSSGNAAVATVDATGLVTGVAAGEAEITATSSGVTGHAALTIMDPVPTTAAVTPDTVALTALGQTEQLSAEVRDQAGRVMEGVPVSWSSADTAVATVDSAGLLAAVGVGRTTVVAAAGEASDEAVVTVMQSVGSVVVSPAADTVALGDTLRLVAEAFDENGQTIEGAEFAWSSSEGSVATVTDSGLVRGVAEGTATITAAAGGARGTAEVAVANPDGANPDRAVLVAFYHAADGPNWVNSENWLTDAPLGDWYGVDTDAEGRVVRLNLSGTWDGAEYVRHGLSGPIPRALGSLANLERLYLYNNNLSGPIPRELGNLANLEQLSLQNNALTGPIPRELGSLANLERLFLYTNALTGPVPAELGNLTHLKWLFLQNNALTGPIPRELGSLANLERLFLYNNTLAGPIPDSFLQLDGLVYFHFARNESLCVPGTSSFVAWLRGIENRDEPESLCNAADVATLRLLYRTTGGTAWTESAGWRGDGAVEDWHGVTADSLGRVTALDLDGNGLSGRLPATLGDLASMTELRLAENSALSGRLPLSLASLPLRTLHYSGTGLCAPANRSFRDWLGAIPSHEGTGDECAPLTDREILEAFYESAGGPGWHLKGNWLTDRPLREWLGVEVDGQGRVIGLRMSYNNLSGSIPPELGHLTHLQRLRVGSRSHLAGGIPAELGNLANLRMLILNAAAIKGPIPVELGKLANLEWLDLSSSNLVGPIPAELGGLVELEHLNLTDNQLSGTVPAELGDLAVLRSLFLGRNELTGPVPAEFGNLSHLRDLRLEQNEFSGPLPAELGGLAALRTLSMGHNRLHGNVPLEFKGLANLRELTLTGNADMSGALPVGLAALGSLETLSTAGTGLCAPSDAAFMEWFARLPNVRVARCGGMPAAAYLVQAVQSREFPVPLVAGEEALLRVFVTASEDNRESLPPVRATFHRDGAPVHVAEILAAAGPIPTEVDEGSLAASANAVIPAGVVRPGLEMTIEIDPRGTLDPGLGITRRIPEEGRLAVDVREMPILELTVIPFLWSAAPDSAILGVTAAMAADPDGHELLAQTRTVLPVGELKVTAHEPVLHSSNDGFDIRKSTAMMRAVEGGTGHWMGMMSGEMSNPGSAEKPGWSSIMGRAYGAIAHELGHNMDLAHAPCGGATDADPAFPYPDGSIGVWGYDFRRERLLPPTTWKDDMGYCYPSWISDYHFTKALRHRLADEAPSAAALAAAPVRSLLLWGGVDLDGNAFMDPVFVVDAPPALPDSAGDYTVTGRDASGRELFSLGFAMSVALSGEGEVLSFVFALPAEPEWTGALASVTLSGPAGTATLDGDSDMPMAILRDPRTGQVRAILRDAALSAQAAMAAAVRAAESGLDVLFSRGIPSGAAWRR